MFEIFFLFLTLLGNYAFIWFSLAVAVAIRQKNRAEHIVLTTVSAIGFSFFVTTFLKLFFRQPRPTSNFEFQISNFCPTDYSFPSGHASTSFAAAFVIARFDPKRKWLYFILAGLISYSRLYLGCHHIEDVVVGAILGLIVSMLFLKIVPIHSKPVAKKKRSR